MGKLSATQRSSIYPSLPALGAKNIDDFIRSQNLTSDWTEEHFTVWSTSLTVSITASGSAQISVALQLVFSRTMQKTNVTVVVHGTNNDIVNKK
jgi:hypothetical protein